MQVIQDYFNEESFQTCGLCDVCLRQKKSENQTDLQYLHAEITTLIRKKPITVEELEEIIAPRDHELFVDVVREMVDDGKLVYDDAWRLNIGKA
jgi:ATP-dependent DNA helicase RecQ